MQIIFISYLYQFFCTISQNNPNLISNTENEISAEGQDITDLLKRKKILKFLKNSENLINDYKIILEMDLRDADSILFEYIMKLRSITMLFINNFYNNWRKKY